MSGAESFHHGKDFLMFPVDSARVWLSFLKGETPWSSSVRSAVLAVASYASDLAVLPKPGPELRQGLALPRPPVDLARELLEALVSVSPPEKPDWHFLADWGLQLVQQSLARNQINATSSSRSESAV